MTGRKTYLTARAWPRLLTLVTFLVAVNALPHLSKVHLVGYTATLAVFWVLSGPPVRTVAKRLLAILPFVGLTVLAVPFRSGTPIAGLSLGFTTLTVTREGLTTFYFVLCRSGLSVLAAVVLMTGVPFPEIIRGLQRLGVPKFITAVISFAHRYLSLIRGEALRTEKAWASRYFGRRKIAQLSAAGRIAGRLLVRSYVRSERLYYAMAARGYNGAIPVFKSPRTVRSDYVFLFCAVGTVIATCVLGLLWTPF
jgi:cobalt/nickel transport system permease protein